MFPFKFFINDIIFVMYKMKFSGLRTVIHLIHELEQCTNSISEVKYRIQ